MSDRVLPPELVGLVESGAWASPAWQRSFVAKTRSQYASNTWFILPSGMSAALGELHDFRRGHGPAALRDLFFIDEGASVALPWIDLAGGLPLVDIAGEPWLWLDYRGGGVPTVLELHLTQGWWVLAHSFGALLAAPDRAAPPRR